MGGVGSMVVMLDVVLTITASRPVILLGIGTREAVVVEVAVGLAITVVNLAIWRRIAIWATGAEVVVKSMPVEVEVVVVIDFATIVARRGTSLGNAWA